jgi:branched-chain amino acid transport system permease protein
MGDRSGVVRRAPWLIIAALVIAQLAVLPLPFGLWMRAVISGLLVAMLALGLSLVYQANRVVNFTQDQLGGVSNGFAVSFIVFWGWPYLLGLTAGLGLAILSGVIVEFFVIRRFRHSPRLVLTVATLGIRQLLVLATVLVPRWWGKNLGGTRFDPPFDATWSIEMTPPTFVDASFTLNGHDLVAAIVAPLAIVGLMLFLRRHRFGVAIRAAAERRDRAALLGIPVHRLNTIVWALATTLSFLALFLSSGLAGVPTIDATSLVILTQALGALLIGRMSNMLVICVAAVVLSVLGAGVEWRFESPLPIYPLTALVILVVLLVQPVSALRRDVDAVASWSGAEEIRPLPRAALEHWLVRTVAVTGTAAVAAGVLLLPRIVGPGSVIKATAVFIFAIVGLSLVVLTGWAGQVSLGHMAFVGLGGAAAATATDRWSVGIPLALVIGGSIGALSAGLVGLPALRLRGLYLAVTTLAFALATQHWFLNDRFFGWFPTSRLERPRLFGRWSLDSPGAYYYLSLVVLVAVYLALRGIRNSRTGRVIVALRENERGAQSFAVNPVRGKLTAFVISGAVAGIAGALYSHFLNSFTAAQYDVGDSFAVFIATVVGGLGSLSGGVLGAVYLRGVQLINNSDWRLLSTGGGVLLVLLILPGGLGSLWVKVRDRAVAWMSQVGS